MMNSASPLPSPPPLALDQWSRPRALLAMALLWLGLVRCVATQEPYPHWAMDPLVVWSPPAGLTPFTNALLDLLTLVLASLALTIEALAGRRLMPSVILLAMIGAAPAIWQRAESRAPGAWLEHMRIGLGWTSAVVAAAATVHLARDERIRRAAVAMCLGIVGMLVAKGVVQYWIEHAQSVREFQAHKAEMLAAQGWLPDSEQARMFERRLLQREASGWFGLANVYASVMAACAAPLAAMALFAWREAPRRLSPFRAVGVVIGALAALIGVVLAGAKAGVALVVIGLGLVGLITFYRPQRLLRPTGAVLGVGLPLAALGAVVFNGLAGNPSGQLSLLFRWFYLEGATRIAGDHLAWGTGPAGFKDAWMLAKPPISPENIESPHSVAFDWLACLGVCGVAWIVLIAWMGLKAGARMLMSSAEPASDDREASGDQYMERVMSLSIAACTLVGALSELTILTPEGIGARIVGLVAWIWIAKGVFRTMNVHPRAMSSAAVAGVLVLIHSQIEMTLVRPGSSHWAWLLLAGLAAPMLHSNTSGASATRWSPGVVLSLLFAQVPVVAAIVMVVTSLEPMRRWEAHLATAARVLQRDDPAMGPKPETLHEASLALKAAQEALPGHLPTIESLGTMALRTAYAGATKEEMLALADTSSLQGVRLSPGSANAWNHRALVLAQLAEVRQSPLLKEDAKGALVRAATLDPFGWKFQSLLVPLCRAIGLPDEARSWARRAIEASDRLSLDPEAQLRPDHREQLEAIATEGQ